MSATAFHWHSLRADARAGIHLLDIVGVRMRTMTTWLSVCLAVPIVLVFALRGETVVDPQERLLGIAAGVAIGLIAWVVAALATDTSVLPQNANPRQYRDLEWRIADLGRSIERTLGTTSGAELPDLKQVSDAYQSLRGDLEQPVLNPGWASGQNYILLWIRLHRLEEAMIRHVDQSRLADVLAHDVGRAESSRLYRNGTTLRTELDKAAELVADKPEDPHLRPLLARIRASVNDYRDRRFEALIAGRAQIDQKTTALGIAAVSLLCLAILFYASVDAVVSISAYYLIGVAAALFTQLRKDGVSDSLVDVFGYGQARLRQTLLVSGIAAAAGVIVLAIAAAGTANEVALDDLMRMVVASPSNYLAAVAFGLAPGLLLDRVNAWTKSNITELEETTKGESSESTSRDG